MSPTPAPLATPRHRLPLVLAAAAALLIAMLVAPAASHAVQLVPGDVLRMDEREAIDTYYPVSDSDGQTTVVAWREGWHIAVGRVDPAGGEPLAPTRFIYPGRVSAAEQPDVAVSGQDVYVTYMETGDGRGRVVVAASHDGGRSFSEPKAVAAPTRAAIWEPRISADGDRVYVVWSQTIPGNRSVIRTAGSRDGGRTWPCQTRVSSYGDAVGSSDHDVAVSGTSVHFTWAAGSRLMARRSIDDGHTLGEPVDLGQAGWGTPQIFANGAKVVVASGDRGAVSTSTDVGGTFTRQELADQGGTCVGDWCKDPISVDMSGDLVVASWVGGRDVFARRSTDGGVTFGATTTVGPALYGWKAWAPPHVAVSGQTVGVTWHSAPRPSTREDFVADLDPLFAASDDGGASFSAPTVMEQEEGMALFPVAVARRAPGASAGVAWWRITPNAGVMGSRQIRFRGATVGPPDLQVAKVVPTQGAEDATKLVAGRPAAARVLLRSSVPREVSVPLKVTAIIPGVGTRTVERLVRIRGGKDLTQVVRLPDVPTMEGELHVTAEIDPENTVGEAERANNVKADGRPVVKVKPLRVLFVPVHATGEDPATCDRLQTIADATKRHFEAAWPIDPRTSKFDVACARPEEHAPGLNAGGISRLFATLDQFTWTGEYDRVVGVVPPKWFERQNVDRLKQAAGLAPYNSLLHSALLDARVSGGWATGHEIAHEMGWVTSNVAPEGHLDRVQAEGYWVDQQWALPKGTVDFMHPVASLEELASPTARWTSQLSWDFLVDELRDGPAGLAASETLGVSGQIEADGSATLRDVGPVEGDPAAEDPDGEYVLEQLGADGAVLSSFRFAASGLYGALGVGTEEPPHAPADVKPFAVRVAQATGVTKVRIRKAGATLAERAKSGHAPTVSVTAPSSGQIIGVGDPFTVRWDAVDADGDPLRATVELSVDGGPWMPVAANVAGDHLELTATQAMLGDDVKVRVRTRDGWSVATATSAAFTVAGGLRDGKVAFSGFGGIYTVEPDGSNRELFAAQAMWPRWSPSGKRIAFQSRVPNENVWAGFTAKADGTDRRQVTADHRNSQMSWRKETQLAYKWEASWGEDHSNDGWYLSNDDESRTKTRFGPNLFGGGVCDLSPDGTQFAILFNGEFGVATTDLANYRNISGAAGNSTTCPSYSPDGQKLVGIYQGNVAIFDIATKQRTMLTTDGDMGSTSDDKPYYKQAVWSPTGDWIYFLTDRGYKTFAFGLWRMKVDASQQQQIYDGDTDHDRVKDTGEVWPDEIDMQPLTGLTQEPEVPEPPTADAGGPYTVDEGADVTLDGTASAPGKHGAALAAHRWDTDGDGTFDDATGASAKTTFPDDGDRAVRLQVADADGRTDSADSKVTVKNVAPKVVDAALAPAESGIGLAATITDPGAGDTHTATVDWHDGKGPQPATVVGRSVIATHGEDAAKATITVRDDDGGSGTTEVERSAPYVNQAPSAKDASADVAHGTPKDLDLPATDPESDRLDLEITTQPAHGQVVILDGAAGPRVSYVPDPDYSGDDAFAYRVDDGTTKSATATVTLKVAEPDAEPDPAPQPAQEFPVEPGAPPAAPGVSGASGTGLAPASLDAVLVADDVLTAPTTKKCVSRRGFRITIRKPKGVAPYRQVRVLVNGKQVKVNTGRRSTAPVDLRGLPKGTFRVSIEVTLSSGRKVKSTRKYRTCVPKKRATR